MSLTRRRIAERLADEVACRRERLGDITRAWDIAERSYGAQSLNRGEPVEPDNRSLHERVINVQNMIVLASERGLIATDRLQRLVELVQRAEPQRLDDPASDNGDYVNSEAIVEAQTTEGEEDETDL